MEHKLIPFDIEHVRYSDPCPNEEELLELIALKRSMLDSIWTEANEEQAEGRFNRMLSFVKRVGQVTFIVYQLAGESMDDYNSRCNKEALILEHRAKMLGNY